MEWRIKGSAQPITSGRLALKHNTPLLLLVWFDFIASKRENMREQIALILNQTSSELRQRGSTDICLSISLIQSSKVQASLYISHNFFYSARLQSFFPSFICCCGDSSMSSSSITRIFFDTFQPGMITIELPTDADAKGFIYRGSADQQFWWMGLLPVGGDGLKRGGLGSCRGGGGGLLKELSGISQQFIGFVGFTRFILPQGMRSTEKRCLAIILSFSFESYLFVPFLMISAAILAFFIASLTLMKVYKVAVLGITFSARAFSSRLLSIIPKAYSFSIYYLSSLDIYFKYSLNLIGFRHILIEQLQNLMATSSSQVLNLYSNCMLFFISLNSSSYHSLRAFSISLQTTVSMSGTSNFRDPFKIFYLIRYS